jgi:predicted GIY-YIG superfamily endonuclease
VYIEPVESHSVALKRERKLKAMDHQRKQKLADEFLHLSPAESIKE